jgi:predicted helicase
MSVQLISKYFNKVDKLIQYGGSHKETSIRTAFQSLLDDYCSKRELMLIAELDYRTPAGKIVKPDGTVKDALRFDWGYWESKDSEDHLDKEIDKKLGLGYPNSNILFEDSKTAILIQQGNIVGRTPIRKAEQLDELLTTFVSYERVEVRNFRQAIEQFKRDIPHVLDELRKMINRQATDNTRFLVKQKEFWRLCRDAINPALTIEDVNGILIQHILTEDLFSSIFDEPQFHQDNNIAQELRKVEDTFFTGIVKRNTLDSIRSYYHVIRSRAAEIANHHEKKNFLNVIYENFYKAYNPKAADKLGIVYTPHEIVRFMLESTDYLLFKHFGKILADDNVNILDPATGTGTFICELLEYLPKECLPHKFNNEIHCNEVAILPYYIANLNIEATFKQRMGYFNEFKHICFVDTLDNVASNAYEGKNYNLFKLSIENAGRIKAQNEQKISVVIGNPPYNAN